MHKRRKLKPIAIILLITVPIVLSILGVGTAGLILTQTQRKQEQLRLEQEAYEKEQALLRYQENYNQIVTDMLNGAIIAEKDGNLIKTVWYNTIFQVDDTSTDPYTKVDGVFEQDFNASLERLFNDSAFKESIAELDQNQAKVTEEMKALVNPPEEYEEAYKALKEMYDSYLEFTYIVLYPKGNLTEFSESLLEADNDVSKKYTNAELYVR